jgi:hypothetical protein
MNVPSNDHTESAPESRTGQQPQTPTLFQRIAEELRADPVLEFVGLELGHNSRDGQEQLVINIDGGPYDHWSNDLAIRVAPTEAQAPGFPCQYEAIGLSRHDDTGLREFVVARFTDETCILEYLRGCAYTRLTREGFTIDARRKDDAETR